jgi:hypothetical protein
MRRLCSCSSMRISEAAMMMPSRSTKGYSCSRQSRRVGPSTFSMSRHRDSLVSKDAISRGMKRVSHSDRNTR